MSINYSTPPPTPDPEHNSKILKISLTGMNNKKGNSNSQLSLSQSLLRKKNRKLDSTSNYKTFKATEGNPTNLQSSENISLLTEKSSYSQPVNDDFDDSFDLFLPRKSPKKFLPPKTSSSQSSFFEVKKTKQSKYFDKSGQLQVPKVIKDDDLELAIAVSLEESKGCTVNLKPPKTASGPVLRGKAKKCSQTLLTRRTPADRERIITEKVAIVLMNTNKISTPSPLDPHEPRLLYSAFLNERFNTVKTLWSLSQDDLTKIQLPRFYTNLLISYMDSPLQDRAPSVEVINDEGGDQNLAVSDDDMFCSGDESPKEPSPKRPRSEQDVPCDVDNSPQPDTDSVGATKCAKGDASFDGLSLRIDTDSSPDALNNTNVDYEVETPLKVDPPPATNRSSARRSLGSSFNNDCTLNRHHHKLAADLTALSDSAVSNVIEVRKGAETMYAHGCVFNVRCPKLFEELVKNPKCLDEFSLEVCRALFGFIYAADVGKALTLAEKNQLGECGLRFGLKELADEYLTKEEEGEDASSAELLKTEVPVEEEECAAKVTSNSEDDVIVLDSEGRSADEACNASAVDASEDELDLYLKSGIRFLEKTTSTPYSDFREANERNPSSTVAKPKPSIERYFQDSFPSLEGLNVSRTPHQPEPAKGATPCSSRGINNCVTPGGQLVVSELATPIPDYESMVSPDLKEALQKYGIKSGIGRRKAVSLLRYIYDQIHPPSDHPAVAKAIGDIKSKAPADSDCDVHSLSSESSGDEEIFEDLGDVFHSEQPTSQTPNNGLLCEVSRYIKSNVLLYAAVLKYEPIWLNKFQQALKENGIKCNQKELMDVLDELGITFRTAASQRKRKPARRKNR